jgi:hypothetical protein
MNQFFRNNAIGSVNGPNYGTVGGGSFLVIDGQSVTASSGLSSVAAAGIKVIAVDKHGKELESFSLPTGTSINIDVHVDTGTYVDKITSHNAALSVHGAASIATLQCTNGPLDISDVEKVGKVSVVNGNADVKAKKIGDVSAVNGSVRKSK